MMMTSKETTGLILFLIVFLAVTLLVTSYYSLLDLSHNFVTEDFTTNECLSLSLFYL